MDDFTKALDNWLNRLQEAMAAWNEKNFPTLPVPKLSINPGRTYVKVIRDSSVYCFIDISNGNILKAASYKAPEPKKIPRGNIYSDNLDGCGPYGVAYMSGPHISF